MYDAKRLDALWKVLLRQRVASHDACGGTGYLDVLDRDEELPTPRATACKCRVGAEVALKVAAANIPEEFWGVKLAPPGPAGNAVNFTAIHCYIEHLQQARQGGLGLVMMGENGVGKTASSSLILISAIRAGFSAFYATAQEYISLVRVGFSDKEFAAELEERTGADFMVLDEMGKEHKRDRDTFVSAELDALLRRRRGRNLSTIIVSNFTMDELAKVYGASFASLTSDRMKVLAFKPGDNRTRAAGDWDKLLQGQD